MKTKKQENIKGAFYSVNFVWRPKESHDVLYERTLVFMFLVNKANEVKCGLKGEYDLKLFSCIKLN